MITRTKVPDRLYLNRKVSVLSALLAAFGVNRLALAAPVFCPPYEMHWDAGCALGYYPASLTVALKEATSAVQVQRIVAFVKEQYELSDNSNRRLLRAPGFRDLLVGVYADDRVSLETKTILDRLFQEMDA